MLIIYRYETPYKSEFAKTYFEHLVEVNGNFFIKSTRFKYSEGLNFNSKIFILELRQFESSLILFR